MKNSEYDKIYSIIVVFAVIFTFFGGTLAYWQWSSNASQKTNIILTVQSNFKCEADGGGDITEQDAYLIPTDCTNQDYAIKRTIKVTPTIYDEHSVKMDLWLDINSIDSGLSNSENFNYALTTDPTSCTNGVLSSGTFKGKQVGNKVELFNGVGYNETTTDTYYLYIWLDKAETSTETMDQSFSLSLNGMCENGLNPEKYTLYDLIKKSSVPDNVSSKYVSNSQGINFGKPSGNTNGKGVYTIADTLNDIYPIHYYRGLVENNNVLFANFCWKIVRTTETGGTKLIYSGTPNNGKCNNTGFATQLEQLTAFNTTKKLEAAGYSYGEIHEFTSKTISAITNQTIFSNDITYNTQTGKYSLSDERYIKDDNLSAENLNDNIKNYHYTCFTTDSNSCTNKVYFAYMGRNSTIYFVILSNGETIESVLDSAFNNSDNTTSSAIKNVVDDWYKEHMLNYTDFLEDTIWCNDRSIHTANGWTKNGNILDVSEDKLNFGAQNRLVNNKEPSLYCENPSDRFTVSSDNGNGALTYPTALITLDEASLAGYVWFEDSSNNYLNNDKIWWTMTPTITSANLLYVSVLYSIADNVQSDYTKNSAGGVRPVISLKNSMMIKEGYGTANQPYIIDTSENALEN